MPRRNILLFILISALCLLPACTPPTVSYFPVRNVPGLSLLELAYGKVELKDGLLRLNAQGVNTSYLIVWPDGYSYRVSGSKVEILDRNGNLVAATGEYKQLGGSSLSSIEHYTGEKLPVSVPGPIFVVDDGAIKSLYLWDLVTWPLLIAAIVIVLLTLFLAIRRLWRLNHVSS